MRARRRGTTMIELLICCALIMLSMDMVYMLVVAGNRYLRVSQTRNQLQNEALASLSWLARELSEADPDTFQVSIDPAVKAIVFGSPRDPATGQPSFDNLGRMFWPKFLVYYITNVDGVPCLVRKALAVNPPSPFPPPPPKVDVAVATAAPIRVLGHHATDFQTIKEPAGTANITLEFSMDKDENLGHTYAIQVTTRVYPRN